MTDRLKWEKGEFNTVGRAGDLALFSINHQIRKSNPLFYLKSNLLGFTKQIWHHDDQEVLKEKAERILSKWLEEVGA